MRDLALLSVLMALAVRRARAIRGGNLESCKNQVGASVKRATKLTFVTFFCVLAAALAATLLIRNGRPPDRDDVDALVARVAAESAVVTNDYLARAEISARVVAGSLPAVADLEPQAVLFANIISQSKHIDAIFVGRPNGDFHFVGRWTPDIAPTETAGGAIRIREIRQTPDGRVTTERWFDNNFTELAPPEESEAEYDPRERPWYSGANESVDGESWSDPYVFFTSQKVGITYSVAVDDDGVRAVVGADIVLSDLINFLNERLPTPGSVALVLDRSGTVLATSDLSAENSTPDDIDPRILDAALSMPQRGEAGMPEPVVIHLAEEGAATGGDSVAAIAPVGALDKWNLVVISPEEELVVVGQARSSLAVALASAAALAATAALLALGATYVLRLRSAARTDALTGLLSRYEIVRSLAGPLSRGQSSGALAIIDLNRFKRINDEYGHGIGDFVLREVARRFQNTLPSTASIGRLGGDEFVVVLTMASNPIHQLKLALESLADPILIGSRSIEIAGSAGVTFFTENKPTQLRHVLREADLALYSAKGHRGSSVRIFHRSMELQADARKAAIDFGDDQGVLVADHDFV